MLMKCGHTAQGVKNGKPVCAICIGIKEGAETPDEKQINLENRTAKCCYGNHGHKPSNLNLPFFEHRPTKDTDEYYCGCHGWD